MLICVLILQQTVARDVHSTFQQAPLKKQPWVNDTAFEPFSALSHPPSHHSFLTSNQTLCIHSRVLDDLYSFIHALGHVSLHPQPSRPLGFKGVIRSGRWFWQWRVRYQSLGVPLKAGAFVTALLPLIPVQHRTDPHQGEGSGEGEREREIRPMREAVNHPH